MCNLLESATYEENIGDVVDITPPVNWLHDRLQVETMLQKEMVKKLEQNYVEDDVISRFQFQVCRPPILCFNFFYLSCYGVPICFRI